jgi:hypothetical protein
MLLKVQKSFMQISSPSLLLDFGRAQELLLLGSEGCSQTAKESLAR